MSNYKEKKGYVALASAIIRSGEKEYDVAFLNSDWCETLRELIKLGTLKGSGITLENKGGSNVE